MQKILLAVDGSKSCNKAIGKVAELTKDMNTEITVITVIEERLSMQVVSSKEDVQKEVDKIKDIEKIGKDMINSCANYFKDIAEINTVVKKGNPAEQICEEANSGDYDFIVIADKGQGALKKFFLGSTAEKVVRYCKKTVMVVK